MNNFLVAVAVFLIAVLAAAFAVPRVVHWDSYRGIIEEEATRLLGRDVRVAGAVKIRLLPSPLFSVERITIADTEAGTGEPFFKAELLSGSLAVASLLRGTFQATHVQLTRPVVRLVLDGTGGGNWKNFGTGNGQLPFQISDVALDQVRISDGQLIVHASDRVERLRLETIDGVLSAAALEGPFRFRGTFGADAEKRELRISTTRQEADGSIRFKAALQQLDSGAVYNFDARAIDLAKAPRIDGELSAKVAMPTLTGQQAGAGVGKDGAKSEPDAPLELRAALSADLKLVKLSNLNLAFERQGRPQILTGEATIDLTRTIAIDAQLAAKWLDLDQVIGIAPPAPADVAAATATPKGPGPVEGLLTLAQRLNGFVPDQGQTRLVLDVEQANLGREAVSGLRVALAGKGAETDIREFRLGLPGGSQADIKGLMTGSGVETSFDGDVVLRGGSLARFLAWATGGELALDAARDGAFAMRSKLVASPGAVVAREFTGELAGTIMQGELGYRWQTRPEFSVLIEGPRVDLRPVLGVPDQKAATLFELLTAGSSFGAQARGGNATSNRADAIMRVRAGELIVPGATFVDAAVDLELRGGQLKVNRLTLASDAGIAIDLEGDMPTAESKARGSLRGSVAATSAAAISSLAAFLSIPPDLRPPDELANDLAPLRLAGSLAFASDPAQPVELQLDGDARDTRLAGRVLFEQGVAAWRAAPIDAAVTLAGPRTIDLARLFAGTGRQARGAPGATLPNLPPTDAARASVTVHLTGVPARGLVTHANLADSAPRMSFSGWTEFAAGQPSKAEGQVRFGGTDVRAALALLAPSVRIGTVTGQAIPLVGKAQLTIGGNELRLDGIDATIAGVGLRGRLALDAQRSSLSGRIAVAKLSATALVAPVTAGAAGETDTNRAEPWSGVRFADKPFGDLSGEIDIAAQRLDVPGGVGLDDATFRLAFMPGRIEIRDLEGSGAGGTWSAAARIDVQRDGSAASTMALRLRDVKAARIAPATDGVPPTVDAVVSGAVTLSARGTTPRELVAAATGRGTFAMGEGRLAVLAPPALSTILQTALRGPAEQLAPSIRQALTTHRAPSMVLLPARALDIDVKNGIATVAPVGVETADGQMIGNVSADLKAMTFSAQWRVETRTDPLPPPPGWTTTITPSGTIVPRKPFVPLPPIQLTAVGRFADPTSIQSDVSTEALEREVTVRKLERDLEDLERLRKLDDDRAKEEIERRRAAENAAALQPGASQAPAVQGAAALPVAPAPDPTEPAAVPDTVDPSLRAQPQVQSQPRPAQNTNPALAPAPKPALRPLNSEEHRRIFGGG